MRRDARNVVVEDGGMVANKENDYRILLRCLARLKLLDR